MQFSMVINYETYMIDPKYNVMHKFEDVENTIFLYFCSKLMYMTPNVM